MSHQFDVFPNPLRAGREHRPYLVDVQHPFFEERATRIVAPLVIAAAILPHDRLNPVVTVQRKDLHFSPTEMFTISLRNLRNPVANLSADRDRLIAAIDLVFTGI